MKAMVLAAGRGERLRPLTDSIPKALVEVAGKPLIGWQLERLAAAGCREIVVNVSHLGERIVERIGDGSSYGLRVAYSREPQPLETAGGIAHALPILGKEPFLVVNADVYCEIDYSKLIGGTLRGVLGHLVLVDNPSHHPKGDFSLRDEVIGNDIAPRYTYAGIALMSSKLVEHIEAGTKAALGPILRSAAERAQLTGEHHAGLWQDVGTSERLAELEALLASRK